MLIKDITPQFPTRRFSDLLNEKLESVKQLNSTISDKQIQSFLNQKSKLFEFEDLLIGDLLNALKSRWEESIPSYIYDKIEKLWIQKLNMLISWLNNINPSWNWLNWMFQHLEDVIREHFYAQIKMSNHNPSNEFLVDYYITELDNIVEKLKNRNKQNPIDNETIKLAKEIKKLWPETLNYIKSIRNAEVHNTEKKVEKISKYYFNEAEKSENHFEWVWVSFLFLIIMIWLWFGNKGDSWYNLLPIYSILTIFILFFFKQYNKWTDIKNSYRFKSISADFMTGLLDFRWESNDSKIIIEKVLDKILEDPSTNQKKGNDTVNLITNNLKTPWWSS